MASDRWRSEEKGTAISIEGKKSSGVHPCAFHKKLRNEKSTSERRLDDLLQLAANNEVVQNRHQYTIVQKLQRETYHNVTSLDTFPLQDLAMTKYNEMLNENSSASTKHAPLSFDCKKRKLNDDTELWSMEPRIFSVETSSTGKRRYIVGNLGRFIQHYWRECDPMSRHYYELIPEGTPCRLYFDLEYSKEANQQITLAESESLITDFIDELCIEILQAYNIQMNRSCVVDLDASTSIKFSRHLMIHFPNGELFEDAFSTGLFVKRFIGRLADELSTGVLGERRVTLAKYLFVNKQTPKNDTTSSNGFDNKNMTCFVDLGVYTRNRLFRLMGSFKYGKSLSSALRIADTNEFCFPDGFDNSKFYSTNHIPIDDAQVNSASTETKKSRDEEHESFCAALNWQAHSRALALTLVVPTYASKTVSILMEEANGNGSIKPSVKVASGSARHNQSSRIDNGESPIPKLDKFILHLATRGGIQGKIRAWSIEGLHFISYQMLDNRYCENIGRVHKSNNIIWNVDLACKTFWQTCYDTECRASNFRGNIVHLPEEVATSIDDYLLDQELATIDESKVIREANKAFGDDEFDKALGEIDMSQFK